MNLLGQVKDAYGLRRDPIILYYIARTYDRIGKPKDALEHYRRFLGSDPPDSPVRTLAVERVLALTPPPPGQKFLWPALALGVLGAAGVFGGVGLFVQSARNYNDFQQPSAEVDKRSLRDRGEPLALGSTIAYGIGGGLLGGAAIFSIIALKKGVRKQPDALIRSATPPPDKRPRVSGLWLLPQAGSGSVGLTLQGGF